MYSFKKILQKNKSDYQAQGFLKNKISLIFNGDGFSFLNFVKLLAKYM